MAFVTGSIYDNYWVSHPIPRSDLQYSWITASIDASNPYPALAETFGHAPEDGYVSSSVEGVVPAYNFVSASDFGSYLSTVTGRRYFGATALMLASDATRIWGPPVDFIGLNTYIDEPITSSQNYLGLPSALSMENYFNKTFIYTFSHYGRADDQFGLNSILLNRNGPYQYPSWKQVRTGEHAVARYHRRNNILAVQDSPEALPPGESYSPYRWWFAFAGGAYGGPGPSSVHRSKGYTFTQYNEPPITSKFMPIQQNIQQEGASYTSWFQYTHGNNKNMFSNPALNDRLNFDPNSIYTIYDEFLNALGPTEFRELVYKETVYPREINTFLRRSRQRENFTNRFWREEREDRQQIDAQNSQGYTIETSSMWPLDARDSFANSSVIGGQVDGSGELQNGYTTFHMGAACADPQLINNASLKLNGVDEYVELVSGSNYFRWLDYPSTGSQTASGSFSISAWFKTTSDAGTLANQNTIVSKYVDDLGKRQYKMYIVPGGKLMSTLGATPPVIDADVTTSSVGVVDNQWHHAVMTSDGDLHHLWLDGIYQDSALCADVPQSSDRNVHIGAGLSDTGQGENFFAGHIDEVSFWNTFLTASVDGSGVATSGKIYEIYNDGCPTDLSQYFSASMFFSHNFNSYLEIDDAAILGKPGLSYYFDCSAAKQAIEETRFTMSMWIRAHRGHLNPNGSPEPPMVLWVSGEKDMALYITSDGTIVAEVSDTGNDTVSSSPGYNDGFWHNVIWSCDTGPAGIETYLWIDGVLVDTENAITFDNCVTSTKMYFGGHPDASASGPTFYAFASNELNGGDNLAPYSGYIDEVSLWNFVFSDLSASVLYNSGSPTNLFESPTIDGYVVPSGTVDPQLLVWYRMGDDCRDSTDPTPDPWPATLIYDQAFETFTSASSASPYYHATPTFAVPGSGIGIYNHGPEGLDAWYKFDQIDGTYYGTPDTGISCNNVMSKLPRGSWADPYLALDPEQINYCRPYAYYYATSSLAISTRYQTLLDPLDTPGSDCMQRFLPCPVGALYARRTPEYDITGKELGYFAGDTLWEVGSQSGKLPFYDSYGHYQEDLRGIGKDYTIVPEFRISEHMEHYVNTNGGNFLADNSGVLTLEGASISSSAEDNFYTTYSHSDFLKYFDVIEHQHDAATRWQNVKTLTLQCNALMKFLPYDGFYPADRTLQLATMFSQSYADNVNVFGGTIPYTFGTQPSLRTFTAPLFGPGVLYNSIKSGVAVDWPQMTSTYSTTGGLGVCDPTLPFYPQPAASVGDNAPDLDLLGVSSSARINSNFDIRIPFEALVDPQSYLTVPLFDMEPHPSASMDSIAKWNGHGQELYRLAMHNFLAESINFYLENRNVTTLISKEDNDTDFFNVEETSPESGKMKEYKMRIVLRSGEMATKKQILDSVDEFFFNWSSGSQLTRPTMTMYNRPSAFGPPTHAYGIHRQESYEPFTPPYYDGYSEVELTFKPTFPQTRYTVDEIVNQTSAEYYRVGTQFATASSPASGSKMHIDASINFNSVTRLDNTTYEPITGRAVSVVRDESTPSVWFVQPKWETPILDFSNVSVTLPVSGAGSISKGMWHQYGSEPSAEQGIYLQIQDLDSSELNTSVQTGSLADLVGFSKDPIRLGKTPEEFEVREAVVAIPYYYRGRSLTFFDIGEEQINAAKFALGMPIDGGEPEIEADVTIKNMIEAMERYVFPPKFDFLNQETINPIVMYIFEFKHRLKRKDLTDMWQNLPPDIGMTIKEPESSVVSITHDAMSPFRLATIPTPGGGARRGVQVRGHGSIPDDLRWMVFKVKQKAHKNYYDKIRKSAWDPSTGEFSRYAPAVGSRDYVPKYSYNWPYDFFSLVELVKLDATTSIAIEPDEDDEFPDTDGFGGGTGEEAF